MKDHPITRCAICDYSNRNKNENKALTWNRTHSEWWCTGCRQAIIEARQEYYFDIDPNSGEVSH